MSHIEDKKTIGDHISSLWVGFQEDMTKVAAPALFIIFIVSTATALPGAWDLDKVMFVVVQGFLDFAGVGLLVMARKQKTNGGWYKAFGVLLIALTIISSLLATLKGIIPAWSQDIAMANDGLILVRSVVSILYGVIIHNAHLAQEEVKKAAAKQQQHEDKIVEANDRLALDNQTRLAAVSSEITEIKEQVAEIKTSITDLSKLVASLAQSTHDVKASQQADVQTLHRELTVQATTIQVFKEETLNTIETTLDSAVDGLLSRLSTMHSSLSSVIIEQLTEELPMIASVSTLNNRGEHLDTPLDTTGHPVEHLDTQSGHIISFTGHPASAGHSLDVQGEHTGHALDTDEPRTDELEVVGLEQRIREVLGNDQSLSGRKLASIVGCSPTTANGWKSKIEKEQRKQREAVH